MRNVLFSSKEAAAKEASGEKTEKPKPDEDEKLLHEMEELTNIIDRNMKKAKKKVSKRRQKVRLKGIFQSCPNKIRTITCFLVNEELYALAQV